MATQAVKVRNEEGQSGSGPLPGAGLLLQAKTKWLELRRFLHEVRVETRQVTWPSRDDVRSTTAVVIVTVFFFAGFFLIVDSGYGKFVQWLFNYFKP
jgi:preprotein translocase subunit SecE